MSKFEDHLWREVARQHGPHMQRAGRPQPRHSRLRPRMLAAGSILGLAGAGTAVALVLGAASASPAFAVTRNHDGTVTVWVRRFSGIAGANAKLHQLGIRATVLPQAPARCSDLPITQQGAPARGGNFIAHRGDFTDAHWTISRKVPAGRMLALTPAPAPSLTPAPGSAGNSGNSGAATTGNSGTATTGAGPAPSGNNGGAGKVWTCDVPVQPTPGSGAGNSGNSGNSGNPSDTSTSGNS